MMRQWRMICSVSLAASIKVVVLSWCTAVAQDADYWNLNLSHCSTSSAAWAKKTGPTHIYAYIFKMLWPNLIIFGTRKGHVMTNSATEKLNINTHYECTPENEFKRCASAEGRRAVSHCQTPSVTLIEPAMWPSNSPELNLVDYVVWGALFETAERLK